MIDPKGWGRAESDGDPFPHAIIDNFLENPDVIAHEFLPFDSPNWFCYDQAHQIKKACNNWFLFPPETYKLFQFLMSPGVIHRLSRACGVTLVPDMGLHGGGWHAHGNGGVLAPHLDYSIHPKMGMQRKINIIIYVEPRMEAEYGGHLGLWEGDSEKPGKLVREIAPLYNRAVIFDTTKNSWHGMSRPLTMPEGVYRRSLAVYYLCAPDADAPTRDRATFRSAP